MDRKREPSQGDFSFSLFYIRDGICYQKLASALSLGSFARIAGIKQLNPEMKSGKECVWLLSFVERHELYKKKKKKGKRERDCCWFKKPIGDSLGYCIIKSFLWAMYNPLFPTEHAFLSLHSVHQLPTHPCPPGPQCLGLAVFDTSVLQRPTLYIFHDHFTVFIRYCS